MYNSNLQKPRVYTKPSYKGRVTKWLCGGLQIRIRGFKSPSALLFIFLFLILIFLVKTSSANILINEVVYDPEKNDNYYEWIELYNPTNKSINLSDWSITDNSQTDFIKGNFIEGNGSTNIKSKSYAIITDHGTKIYEDITIDEEIILLYIDDSSIGNGLSNSGDKIILKNKTGEAVDSIEWIKDYEDVPGIPANKTSQGSSLSRFYLTDNDNSSIDFYEEKNPTPGRINIYTKQPLIEFSKYPKYIVKIAKDSEYSLPFSFKINISNFSKNQTLNIKSFILGDNQSSWPASQTWDGRKWAYSNYYNTEIKTDECGNWSGLQYLRFNKEYIEYQKNIIESNKAYLKIKIKSENISFEKTKKIFLLDMDSSTSNATKGGYIIGKYKSRNQNMDKKFIIAEDTNKNITALYQIEENEIEEGFVSIPGYYKIASPVGNNYTIKFLDENFSLLKKISNISINQGKYGVDINSNRKDFMIGKKQSLKIPLFIKNKGDFNDTIIVNITDIKSAWKVNLEEKIFFLKANETIITNIEISPPDFEGCLNGFLEISIRSINDLGEYDKLNLNFEILAPDLFVKNLSIYNEFGKKSNSVGHGEIIKIKSFIKNIGNKDAKNVLISCYYNTLDKKNLISTKIYDNISKYQKYPSFYFDTKNVLPGSYKIYVVADFENKIDEIYETNNILSDGIEIFKTNKSKENSNLLITELYYHAHPKLDNEFISLFNSGQNFLNISNYYFTNNPLNTKEKQTKIIFPKDTIISPNTRLYITKNSSNFFWETGKNANFEYDKDSNIPEMKMIVSKEFFLSNKGGVISLKDKYNHTIDTVVYGEINVNISSWKGESVPKSGAGVILKRNIDERGKPTDTNSNPDWISNRRYGIGQSDFKTEIISFNGEIKTFVSPDNSYQAIINELKYANESIYFNIYEFTNPYLCDEIINALLRGVRVSIFLEGSPIGGISDEEKYILNRINNYGGKIRFIVNDNKKNVYARYTFDHGKYLIIDNETVIVESCNWVKTGLPIDSSYGNREWGIIIKNKKVARYFLDVFLDDFNKMHCDSYSFKDMDFDIKGDSFISYTVHKGDYHPRFKCETFKDNFTAIPVFSPDNSYQAIINMINSSKESIYIQQLYIYKDWDEKISPFVEKLVDKAQDGIDIKIILNYNPHYEATNEKTNISKRFLEENNIKVKYIFSNWSYFSNVHNKGMIVDNKSVLISSINWNENSVRNNREAGIIIESKNVANYYKDVFFNDWNLSAPVDHITSEKTITTDYKNTIYIVVMFTLTFALVARDWRKRQWT